MKKVRPYSRERGQATMEVAICAVAIVFLVMGFFTLGGLGITSIKSLLLTRYHAEKEAENKTFGSSAVSRQISGWEYTQIKRTVEGGHSRVITIPFLAHDQERRSNHGITTGGMEDRSRSISENPSLADSPEDADYIFTGLNHLPGVQRPSLLQSGNSAVLASLHVQEAVLPSEAEKEQLYLFRTMTDSRDLKQAYYDKGWLDIRSIDITQWPSSLFAFPAFAPQK